jgi:hypothetical protein
MIYAQHYWFRGQKIIVMQDLTRNIISCIVKQGQKGKNFRKKAQQFSETIREFGCRMFQFLNCVLQQSYTHVPFPHSKTKIRQFSYRVALHCKRCQRWNFESIYAVEFNLRSFDLSWNFLTSYGG